MGFSTFRYRWVLWHTNKMAENRLITFRIVNWDSHSNMDSTTMQLQELNYKELEHGCIFNLDLTTQEHKVGWKRTGLHFPSVVIYGQYLWSLLLWSYILFLNCEQGSIWSQIKIMKNADMENMPMAVICRTNKQIIPKSVSSLACIQLFVSVFWIWAIIAIKTSQWHDLTLAYLKSGKLCPMKNS